MSDLDTAMRGAHRASDGAALIGLYAEAAAAAGTEARPFFLTQAWIHALERGDPRAEGLAAQLKALDRL